MIAPNGAGGKPLAIGVGALGTVKSRSTAEVRRSDDGAGAKDQVKSGMASGAVQMRL
jgi:hypothetical protein